MPKFIKMGLGGTGFMGKPTKSLRAMQRFNNRRKVLPGFPITEPFQSIEDVREYLSGDRVVCLLCGRSLKKLGCHINKIHGIDLDKYRSMYNIPWTYGLLGTESKQLYSQALKQRIADGFTLNLKYGDAHVNMISAKRRGTPFKSEIGCQNLGTTLYPDGLTRRQRETTRRGSKEYHEKMRNRPQCSSENMKRLGCKNKGRKQSPEHIAKRFKRYKPDE